MCCHMLYRRTVTRTARLTLTRALGTNSRSWQTGARGTRDSRRPIEQIQNVGQF